MQNGKRKRIKIGNVYAIPLPNGKYAFGRKLRDGGIAIYKYVADDTSDLPKEEQYQLVVGVYDYVLKSGEWEVVDFRPFENDDEAWPPMECIIDSITGEYSIYYKGEIRKATKEECEGLEEASVWGAEHIIDRIMGDDKWHKR